MKYKKLYNLLLLITSFFAFSSCEDDDDTIRTFERSFPIGASSQLTDIVVTDDANYLALGTATINKAEALILMKVSPAGDTLWTRKYLNNQAGNSIVKTRDGNYAITGSTEASLGMQGKSFVMKVDKAGNKLWFTYLSGVAGAVDFNGFNTVSESSGNIAETVDGKFLLVHNHPSIYQSSLLEIVSPEGTIEHSVTLPDVAVSSIKAINNGAFMISGSSQDNKVSLTKVNASGDIVWSKKLGEKYNNSAYSLVQTADGGLAMTGYAGDSHFSEPMMLLQTNQHGEKTGFYQYDQVSLKIGYYIDVKKNNDFLIAGYGGVLSRWRRDANELIAVSVSSSGELQYSRSFGVSGHFSFIKETNDSGVILGGKKNGHIYITKTKPDFSL